MTLGELKAEAAAAERESSPWPGPDVDLDPDAEREARRVIVEQPFIIINGVPIAGSDLVDLADMFARPMIGAYLLTVRGHQPAQ